MRAQFKTREQGLVIQCEADTVKALVKQVAKAQEVLDADDTCGRCESPRIQFRVRFVDPYEFIELHCLDCGAALSFGESARSPGDLYPKRYDENRKALPNRGWKLWNQTAATPPAKTQGKQSSSSSARPIPPNGPDAAAGAKAPER